MVAVVAVGVSNPNGLPRPFSHGNGKVAKSKGKVSNPNGLPRPFSRRARAWFNTNVEVSNPNGLPRPFSLEIQQSGGYECFFVSNPNGLPRPFSHTFAYIGHPISICFKPERASQAI